MTVKQTLSAIKAMGLSCRRTEHGEYRVNLLNGSDDTAYYTDDSEDAIGTAKAMLQHCHDPRHETPCKLPCAACADECTQ